MTTYDTPGPVTLRLSIAAGAIEVRTVDGSQTTVQVDAHGGRSDALDDVREEIRPAAGGGHEVIVEAPRSRGFALGRSASYLVTVSAPHGADLHARTASGEVNARGRLGQGQGRAARPRENGQYASHERPLQFRMDGNRVANSRLGGLCKWNAFA